MTRAQEKKIKPILRAYAQHRAGIELFHDQLVLAIKSSIPLSLLIHSVRSRLKDPAHLQDKLLRKWKESEQNGKYFDITEGNVLTKINDLVGIRVLHLHTRQIQKIDEVLREILEEHKFGLIEGPFARTWDDESREFFRTCDIETEASPSMYTSVHYVVESASRTKMTAEIQVRTLMEEVWGEVDHKINYPHNTNSSTCREQIKVLARVTSSATRLVDSIFSAHNEHQEQGTGRPVHSRPRRRPGPMGAS